MKATLHHRRWLPLTPAQLAAQSLEEAASAHADQVDGMQGSAAANLIADEQLDALLTVDGEQRRVDDALDAYDEQGVAARHDRPEREQVRADGRDHHGVHV